MKKQLVFILVMAMLLAGCQNTAPITSIAPQTGTSGYEQQTPAETEAIRKAGPGGQKAHSAQQQEEPSSAAEPQTGPGGEEPEEAPSDPPQPEAETVATAQPEANPPAPQPESQPEPEPTSESASLAYGAVPFSLAAGTDKWWKIDASDSAYWAVQENINSIRASAGLDALSMDDSLSTVASGRCESFVAGGAFDHSGMTTKSEVCAAGPLFSAGEVCSAWQNSEAHYAAMTRSDISRIGVGCWFCDINGNRYTYWVAVFE